MSERNKVISCKLITSSRLL